MGVPITFLDKYNPDQFEILGIMASTTVEDNFLPYVDGKKIYARVVIKNKIMTTGSNNSNLRKAAKVKADEFYTQLSDIEKELQHYKKHFKNKIVYCNCDDPRVSNFQLLCFKF